MVDTRSIGSATRIINLSFKLTGIKDETNTIKTLTGVIYQAITAIRIARLAWKAFQLELGPAGWLMLGASLLSEAVIIKTEFSDTEESVARGI